MKRSILEIYALVVCFFATICIAFSSFVVIRSISQWSAPALMMPPYRFATYQSNDAFCEGRGIRPPPECENDEKNVAHGNAAAIEKVRAAAFERALILEKRDALHDLAESLIWLVVSIGIFGSHWVIGSKARALLLRTASADKGDANG